MGNISASARINEINHVIKKMNQNTPFYNQRISTGNYKPGISIVIPTSEGESHILHCINSLYKQSLTPLLFDVIIIVNGKKDATEEIINDFIRHHKLDNFTINYIKEANVSKARNVGMKMVEREYITFLDDDDYLSENYLEKMYQYASDNTVVLSQIIDINTSGEQFKNNLVNQQIMNATELENIYLTSLSFVMSMNACKTLPTYIVQKYIYNESLTSGEDVVFFTELFTRNNLRKKIIPIEDHVVYYRLLRDDSISRQKMTFDFYVQQRLDVIKNIDDLLKTTSNTRNKQYIKQKINNQLSFVRKYLTENLEEKSKVLSAMDKYEFSYLPLKLIEPIENVEKV